MRYVIIGNSTAAIGAVEGIRKIDAKGSITVVSSEPHHTYSRPLISYLLLGKTTEESMRYRPDTFYADNDCHFMGGATVTAVDAQKKQLTLDNGSTLPYDRLLVATGSSPLLPNFAGLETVPQYFKFMNLDDAKQLDSALGKDKRVLIVGAGLIGLKCAEGIFDRVKSITVADMAPRILSSILDDEGAQLTQRYLEQKGIRFALGSGVSSFDQNMARLDNGETIEFDLLVLCVGVRPNTELLSGIADIDRAILVDSRSQTCAKDIYAAGDCTQTQDISSGQSRVMAIIPNAYQQGECAGINMAGGECSFEKAIPMNAIGFFGLHMVTAGSYIGDMYTERSANSYKCLFHSQNRLNGYILIGKIEKAGIYTALIREQTPLDSIDFGLICKNPGLMAFSRQIRKQKLGGSV